MTVEIKGVEITEESVKIEAIEIEKFLFADDLFEDAEAPKAIYEFSRKDDHGRAMKYLWKVCSSQKKCQECKSFGEMLENLIGSIIFLSENFKIY